MRQSSLILLLSLLHLTTLTALPKWSWSNIQTYIHCANVSGPWNSAAINRMVQGAFVVFEKDTGLFAPPMNTSAETKITAACAQVKAKDPSVDCYMYTESDWARTWYTLGHTFDAHPEWELHADAVRDSPLISTTEQQVDDQGKTHNYNFNAYDFSVSDARDAWVKRVTDAVATGFVDGAFIDGNRGGWKSGILSGTTPAHAAAWAEGLNASHRTLAAALPKAILISNYATTEAMEICNGAMMERGGAGVNDISLLQELGETSKVVEYHAQYANNQETFNRTLAAFLAGMEAYAYYGAGVGWNGNGESACSTWLEWKPEYTKPLGAPTAKAVPVGGVYTRSFATGTKCKIDTNKGGGSCIWWSDGSETGDEKTCKMA